MFILVRRIRNSFKLFQRGFHNGGTPKQFSLHGVAKIASYTLYYPLLGSSALIGTYLCFLILTDEEETPTFYPKSTSATLIRRLPFNATSRFICWLAECPVPVIARPVIYSIYATLFDCDLSELKYPDLKQYASVSDFFSRELATQCRPIDEAAALVSPADGKILHFGAVDRVHPVLEQVKGVNYSLREFLGPVSFDMDNSKNAISQKNNLRLYQCVIYLGPGDCHRFFNPTDWTVLIRRHFPGKLLSVRPQIASRLPGLYTLNERVAYLGTWSHGFMSFVAVGAVGVGGICIPIDPTLSTNRKRQLTTRARCSDPYPTMYSEISMSGSSVLQRGSEFGYFRFGSTIVLLFEAPEDARWCVKSGDHIRFGQALLRTA